MPTDFTIDEKFASRSGDGVTAEERLYIVTGSDDETAIRQAVAAAVPLYVGHLRRRPATIQQVGPLLWEARVQFCVLQNVLAGSTSGASQHITQGRQTVGRHPASAPDFGGAIGVSRDSVDGVDILVPQLQFSITQVEPVEDVPANYIATLFHLTSRTNNAPYMISDGHVMLTFQRGELLFLGADFNKRIGEHWEFLYKFSASPNVYGVSLGSIGGIDKRGWEYLWVRYADDEDKDAAAIVKKPIGVYVERVYDEADFTLLRI